MNMHLGSAMIRRRPLAAEQCWTSIFSLDITSILGIRTFWWWATHSSVWLLYGEMVSLCASKICWSPFLELQEGGDEADSSSEQDGSSGYRRRRRAAVNMEQDEASINGVSPQKKWQSSSAPATDSPPEAGFRCAPCGFTCEDQGVFLEHISQHRKVTGASTQQCLQCGVCFTSNHSLSRHRFIVHKVKDSDNQDAPLCPAPSPGTNHDSKSSQGCSAPASPAVPQEKDCEGALTCKVCGKQFEKATDLNTHFRTHGMAFINARKIN